MNGDVLVTGGCGFIGSHLVEHLLFNNAKVIILDRNPSKNIECLKNSINCKNLTIVNGDISNERSFTDLINNVSYIYHLAATVGIADSDRDPVNCMLSNIISTEILLRSILNVNKPIKLFLASSGEVYGKNSNKTLDESDDLIFGNSCCQRWSYGLSKITNEMMASTYKNQGIFKLIIGRIFNIAGPRQSLKQRMVFSSFIEAAKQNRPLIVHGTGKQVRSFMHVKDLVKVLYSLMFLDSTDGELFNIGGSQPISILDLARRIITLAGSDSTIQFIPFSDAFSVNHEDPDFRVPNLTKLKSYVEYTPCYSLDDIIIDCLNK